MDIPRAVRAITATLDVIVLPRRTPNELPAGNIRTNTRSIPPDLQTQLEDLLDEVWRQEKFEHNHPYTCGVIRQLS